MLVGPVLIVAYLFRPRSSSATRVWLYALGGLFSTFAMVSSLRSPRELFVRWVIEALRGSGLNLPSLATDEYFLPYFVVLCGTVCILLFVWVLDGRRTITVPPPESVVPRGQYVANERRDFPDALRRYCGALSIT